MWDCNVSFRSISDQISDHVSLALYDSEGRKVMGNISRVNVNMALKDYI